ncbi:fluoride efflux transporter FluC [Staphylococcus caeli]|uniref:Fluoride-specific ion channel FluC n=1 Tax=Staphylococcus caeli TaxID=2201815 RepID=A0A1D4JJI6_9STAP|nr:CrcB family protein [Staphylococcus caeli]SCS33817.1 CrcB-like protein [Staphylococcus caeli]SCS61873.1 CrcB-like protein [Staphylococcus caeli]
MINVLLVMLGGGIGAVIRAAITNICNAKSNYIIPIGTPIVNIVGSMLIGLFMGMALHVTWLNAFLVVGILGGLTTFSTLSSELVQLLTIEKNIKYFIIYSILQYGTSFLACFLGYILI